MIKVPLGWNKNLVEQLEMIQAMLGQWCTKEGCLGDQNPLFAVAIIFS